MRRVVVVAAAAVVLVGLVPGMAQAKAKKPVVLQVRTTSSVTLASAAATETTVESLSLPKGSWTVSSDLTAINFGAGDYVRCQLQESGTLFDGGQTVYLADRVSGLHNVGTVVVTKATTVAVLCDHDHAARSSGQFYVDPGATLTAVDGGPIDGPGAAVTSKAAVVESRSTASADVDNGSLTTVTSVTLPKGTWAVTATLSAVNFSDDDFVGCEVDAAGNSVESSGYAEVDVGSTSNALVTGLDVEAEVTVSAKSEVASLDCGTAFSDTSYLDAGATLTATKVAASAVQFQDVPATTLPDAAGGSATVFTTSMPAGSWRVRSSVPFGNQASNGGIEDGPQDFLRCGLRANGNAIDGGATELITDSSYIQDVVNAGTYTSTSPWTLSVVCSHDATNTTDGQWTTQYGSVQAVNLGPIN
jgi:hypothetical protein